jgi:glycerol-3-phosphate O-acyltransferase
MLEGVKTRRYRDVTLVPIAISYEKVVEGDTFPLELLGEEKVQESFIRLVKSAKLLKENYGRIYVDLVEPVSLAESFAEHGSA